jgi:hypothetical protein
MILGIWEIGNKKKKKKRREEKRRQGSGKIKEGIRRKSCNR